MKPGDTLGRYEIHSLIARGGMAEVWLARATGAQGFRKKVVIKTILPHLSEDPEFTRMFINEALLAARLNHPHIVQIFDLGSRDEHYYIAMEHVPGRSLRQIVRELRRQKKWIPPWFVLRVAAAVCEGLHYAHNLRDDNGELLGLVHRDVSPENIMVSYTGMVKVLDFGVAKATKATSFTRAGTLKGKYSYMAPEQIQGRPVDRRIDVYSVGVILYEFLTRRRPFQGTTDLELLKQITEGKVIPPRALVPRMPKPLEEVILRAISRDPDRRFSEAQLLGDELQVCLTGMKDSHTQRDLGAFVSALFPDIADQVSDPGGGPPASNGKAAQKKERPAAISPDGLREKIQQLSQARQPASAEVPTTPPVDSVARTEKWVARVKDALAGADLPPKPAAVKPAAVQAKVGVNASVDMNMSGTGESRRADNGAQEGGPPPTALPKAAPSAPEQLSAEANGHEHEHEHTGRGVVDTDVETPDIDVLGEFSSGEIVFTYIKRPGEDLLLPKATPKPLPKASPKRPAVREEENPAPASETDLPEAPPDADRPRRSSPFKTGRRGKHRREQDEEPSVGSLWGPKRKSRRAKRAGSGGLFSRVSSPPAEEAPAPEVDPEVAAEAARHFDRGLELLRRGEPELALVEWQKAAELNPHEQTYQFNIQHLTKKRDI